MGACAVAGEVGGRSIHSAYRISTFAIYALAIGLALITFIIKNWRVFKAFFTYPEIRTGKKKTVIGGVAAITLLLGFFALGILVTGMYEAFSIASDRAAIRTLQEKQIADVVKDYDELVGKYKWRGKDEYFKVQKGDEGVGLRLIRVAAAGKKKATGKGCLLTPRTSREKTYFTISECVVDGKESPLSSIEFDAEKGNPVMTFWIKKSPLTYLFDKIE